MLLAASAVLIHVPASAALAVIAMTTADVLLLLLLLLLRLPELPGHPVRDLRDLRIRSWLTARERLNVVAVSIIHFFN